MRRRELMLLLLGLGACERGRTETSEGTENEPEPAPVSPPATLGHHVLVQECARSRSYRSANTRAGS